MKYQDYYVLQLDQQKSIKILEVDSDFINTVEYNPNSKALATGTDKGEIIIWSLENFKILNKLSTESDIRVLSLTVSSNGKILACANGSCAVLYWQLNEYITASEK